MNKESPRCTSSHEQSEKPVSIKLAPLFILRSMNYTQNMCSEDTQRKIDSATNKVARSITGR